MIESENVVRVELVHKTFGSGTSSLHILRGLELSVHRGEVASIVGASGVGKSTLLHIMGGLDRPTSGSVFLNGTDIYSLGERQMAQLRNERIGFVFQFHHLLPEFTAMENVMMPCLIAGMSEKEARPEALRMLEQVGLGGRLTHRPNQLSGGEQQRVAVARALVHRPDVVLGDEPSGNLDRETSEALHDLLWNLRDTLGQTIVIATHDEGLARRADRVLHLADGQIHDTGERRG